MEFKLRSAREQVDNRSTEYLSSLTKRKASIIRDTTVKKRKYIPYWRRARNKVRGPNLWKSMIDDIYWYGTGPQLTDSRGSYKENLNMMMQDKIVLDPIEVTKELKKEVKAPKAKG